MKYIKKSKAQISLSKELSIIRDRLLIKQDNRCLECRKTANLQICHLIEKSIRGDLYCDERNLIILCYKCHNLQEGNNPRKLLKMKIGLRIFERLFLLSPEYWHRRFIPYLDDFDYSSKGNRERLYKLLLRTLF